MIDVLLDIYSNIHPFISDLNNTETILLVWASIHIVIIIGYILFILFTGLCLVITPICVISSLPISVISIVVHVLVSIIFIVLLVISFLMKNKSTTTTTTKKSDCSTYDINDHLDEL